MTSRGAGTRGVSDSGDDTVLADAAARRALPLSALLSQLLVAFTIEFDNQLEARMRQAGHVGHVRHSEGFVSLAAWLNCVQFIRPSGIAVGEWEAHTGMRQKNARGVLGCLERWGYIVMEPPAPDRTAVHDQSGWSSRPGLRPGFGSSIGTGLGPGWRITPTARTVRALELWPPLVGEIEDRWRNRFGADRVDGLKHALSAIVERLDPSLPDGFPDTAILLSVGGTPTKAFGVFCPPQNLSYLPIEADETPSPSKHPLCVLMARALLAFALEFDAEADVPIALSANQLRVLDSTGVAPADVRRLTGLSKMRHPEKIAELGLAELAPRPDGKRGKVVRLTDAGRRAQVAYARITAEIETRWCERFGRVTVQQLRDACQSFRFADNGTRLALAEGLVPPAGLPRAGDFAPEVFANWPKKVQSNVRHLVQQTNDLLDDPLGRLPHHPSWDGDRGWGP